MSAAAVVVIINPPNQPNVATSPTCEAHFYGALTKCDLEAVRDAIDAKLATLTDKQCA